jgi:hypothetical protein
MGIPKTVKAGFSVLGVVMLIISIAEVPAKLLIWRGWYLSLVPHLHTTSARWLLGFLGIAISLAPWIVEWVKSWQIIPRRLPAEVAEATQEKRGLDLELIPHGHNSPLLCLEVKNKGDDVKITATIRVVSRSYGGPVDTRPYIGRWTLLTYKRRFGDHRPKPTVPVVTIPSGNHRILEIAKQSPENGRGNDTSAAYLVGFGEFLRWDFEPKSDSNLPSFRLQIEFLGEGTKPLCKLYDVGPVAACGPLGMTEVTA